MSHSHDMNLYVDHTSTLLIMVAQIGLSDKLELHFLWWSLAHRGVIGLGSWPWATPTGGEA